MKIIVSVRQLADADRPIRVDAAGDIQVIRWIANPVDEVAVDRAVQLRDAGSEAEIVAVSTCEEYLLSALARGADRGFLVDAVDDRSFAKALAEVAHREKPDLILMGDGEAGPRLAGALDIPQATHVETVDLVDTGIRVTRRLAKFREVLDLTFPAVVTLHSSQSVPKIISLYAIVDARNKHVERSSSATDASPDITVISAEAAPKSRLGKMVGSVDELIHALREEARVI